MPRDGAGWPAVTVGAHGLTHMGFPFPYQDLGQTHLITGLQCSVFVQQQVQSIWLFVKYWLLCHLLVFLNQKFSSWLFVLKLHISGVGEERERRQNIAVYHKEHRYKSLPGER